MMENLSLFDVAVYEAPKKEKLDNSLVFLSEVNFNGFHLSKADSLEFYYGQNKELVVGKLKNLAIQYKKSEIDFYILIIEFEDKSYCSYGGTEEYILITKHSKE